MPRSEADLRAIHKFSSKHRALFDASDRAGCFHCLAEFVPTEILDWVDAPVDADPDRELDVGDTALCPECGIDSVLPSSAPIHWDATLLAEMKAFWFDRRA
jgi:hypothetical protein